MRRIRRALVSFTLIWGAFALRSDLPVLHAQSDSLGLSVTLRPQTPPADITDLTATPGGAEGMIDLTWTEPGDDGYYGTASSYTLRASTIANIANNADFSNPLLAKPLSAFSLTPVTLTPIGDGGSLRVQSITGLEPGVTYYFALRATDDDSPTPQTSSWSRAGVNLTNFAIATDLVPPAPLGLTVIPVSRSTFSITWSTVPATVTDMDFYRVYFDSAAPYDFVGASVTAVSHPTGSLIIGGLSTGTYHFMVTAVDRGAPAYGGVALESVVASTVVAELVAIVRAPQEPYGVAISSGPGGISLRWLPVVRFADGGSFVDPMAPTYEELTGYHVYRSTGVTRGTWTDLISLSTSSLTYTDPMGGPQHYYQLRSQNASGLSDRSVVRIVGSRSAYVVAPDDMSDFEILAPDVGPIEGVAAVGASAYLVDASSRPEDLGGRVVKSLEFTAYLGGAQLAPDFSVEGLGILRMHYETLGTGVFPSGVSNTPDNMSVFWWNGRTWVQMFGRLDSLNRIMTVQTKYFGRYQLRTVERTGSFAFDQAGVSNRFVTPNGDGKNDAVIFTYDNPRESAVTIRVLDRRGKAVATDLQAGPISNSRSWTPGSSIPGGVYIYMISSEGRTYTGTIVLLK